MLQEFGHDCDRFRLRNQVCPFAKFKEDDDPEESFDEPGLKFVVPARRKKDELRPPDAVTPLVFPARNERFHREFERLAAFKRLGELPSIPSMGFPSPGSTPQAILSLLAAIAIMQSLRALRSGGFGTSVRGVGLSETRAASLLKGVGKVSQAGGRSTGGRGGFHMPAPTFRRLLRPPRLRKRRGRFVGFGNPLFDEHVEGP